MGLMASAKCSSCGLNAEQVYLGIGMSPIFGFVTNALSYCAKCEALTTEPRLKSPERLRALGEYLRNTSLRQDELAHLTEALASALTRACGRCRGPLKDIRYSDSGRPIKCPRCSKKALRLEPVGIWD